MTDTERLDWLERNSQEVDLEGVPFPGVQRLHFLEGGALESLGDIDAPTLRECIDEAMQRERES